MRVKAARILFRKGSNVHASRALDEHYKSIKPEPLSKKHIAALSLFVKYGAPQGRKEIPSFFCKILRNFCEIPSYFCEIL